MSNLTDYTAGLSNIMSIVSRASAQNLPLTLPSTTKAQYNRDQ